MRSLDASRIRTASARRKRAPSSPSVTLATTRSPGSVCRTNSTCPSAVRAMQWPPWATGPISTSYSSPTRDFFGSAGMAGRLQIDSGAAPRGSPTAAPRRGPDNSPPVYGLFPPRLVPRPEVHPGPRQENLHQPATGGALPRPGPGGPPRPGPEVPSAQAGGPPQPRLEGPFSARGPNSSLSPRETGPPQPSRQVPPQPSAQRAPACFTPWPKDPTPSAPDRRPPIRPRRPANFRPRRPAQRPRLTPSPTAPSAVPQPVRVGPRPVRSIPAACGPAPWRPRRTPAGRGRR